MKRDGYYIIILPTQYILFIFCINLYNLHLLAYINFHTNFIYKATSNEPALYFVRSIGFGFPISMVSCEKWSRTWRPASGAPRHRNPRLDLKLLHCSSAKPSKMNYCHVLKHFLSDYGEDKMTVMSLACTYVLIYDLGRQTMQNLSKN